MLIYLSPLQAIEELKLKSREEYSKVSCSKPSDVCMVLTSPTSIRRHSSTHRAIGCAAGRCTERHLAV